jgi:endonuclease-3
MATLGKREKAEFIQQKLNELFPEVPIPLDHTDAYTLLVAVVLSAQCTDKRVNEVTPGLFAKAGTPEKMVDLGVEKVKAIIRPCGLSNAKSKNLVNLSKMLIDDYDGKVPDSIPELKKLPGVGQKVASVVVSQAYGQNAFPVDTHIHRLAYRWGLTSGKNVEQTEEDLKKLFPEASWNRLHLQIIYFGRNYCPARNHNMKECPICSVVGRKELLGE